MTRRLAVLVVAVLAGCAPPASAAEAGMAVEVAKVVDGDTIHVRTASGPDKVRVIGIDTPETVAPGKPVGCYGLEASAFAKAHLHGRVRLVADRSQADRDRRRRLLRYVVLADGRDYSEVALRAGMGRYREYAGPVAHKAALVAAESEARAARRGLWGHCG